MLERLLVALDGSPRSEAALAAVRSILRRHPAEVTLLQAVEAPPGSEPVLAAHLNVLIGRAEDYLGEKARELEALGAQVRPVVRVGYAAEVLLQAAEKETSGLLVLATHGRSGFQRWALGSVAEKILHASPLPVLAVRTAPDVAEPAFRRILVPLDGSEPSLAVIPSVAELARRFGAHLLLLNVCEGPACTVPVPEVTRAWKALREAGVSAEPLMRQGAPAPEILEAAREQSADLIAMATHGRSGLSRWALGSVAEKVLRASPVPTLLVRETAPAAKRAVDEIRQGVKV